MIIIGYPGVGKSSVCGKDGIIDLESSFFHSEYANKTWVESYVSVAVDLHIQGYTVCVSSHEAVRNMLRGRVWPNANRNLIDPNIVNIASTNVAMIYPDLSLKDAWIKRLENRYYESRKNQHVPHWIIEKNYRAWQRAMYCYDIDIYGMSQCEEITQYVIKDLETYDARVAIDDIIKIGEKPNDIKKDS